MNDDSNRTAGVESAESGSAADHQGGIGGSPRDLVAAAHQALEGCNKQEAQQARQVLEACLELYAAHEVAAGEGIGGG